MEQETAILITGLQQHKADACQRLLATYGEMVFRMVQRIVTCREDAEEVYQDVFVKALRNIGDYNPRDDTDPLIVMAAQIEEIRSRGQQLHIEIAELINN